METMSAVLAIIAGIISILNIIFVIITFAKNGRKDTVELEARLTGIEKDVAYIRKSIESDEEWKKQTDARILHLEQHSNLYLKGEKDE